METFGITDEDVAATKGFEVLGPAYFAARRMAEAVMAGSDTSPFSDVAKKCADEITEKVYEYVEAHLLSDLELNVQGHVRRMVENTVQALLSGEEWAMRQYPLAPYQDGERIRAAVAKHGGDPLLMARIADLEKEISSLRESLKYARGSY